MHFRIDERVELASIPAAGIVAWLTTSYFPDAIGIGRLLLAISVIILLQGLVRDLWLLAYRRRAETNAPAHTARCMCVESTLGTTGIVAGLVILGSGIDHAISIGPAGWVVLVMATMATGFAIKDYVIEPAPWRIRRDKDHINIVFRWRQP